MKILFKIDLIEYKINVNFEVFLLNFDNSTVKQVILDDSKITMRLLR
jgi:hypothetical protein